jgi:D-tyrosyl-tRNA(Tyr) deacylase
MRLVIQRVSEARVVVDGEVVGEIGRGLLVLVGVHREDTEQDATYLAEKTVHLRIFEDEQGKMNKSLLDVGGGVLAVSQFTLYGDVRKGRRPSFINAALPERAQPLFQRYVEALRKHVERVETGRFGAKMQVHLINEGPVTLIIESLERSAS